MMVSLKKVQAFLVTMGLLAVIVSSSNEALALSSNCESVRKAFPFGIALNKVSIGTSRAEVNRAQYLKLQLLDKDLDGIVCEVEKLQVQLPVSSPVPATNLKVKRIWLTSSTASKFVFTWDSIENLDTQLGTLIYWDATLPTYQYKISVTNLKTLTIDFLSIQPICFTILSEIKVNGATILANSACEDPRTVFTTTTTTTVRRILIPKPSPISIPPRNFTFPTMPNPFASRLPLSNVPSTNTLPATSVTTLFTTTTTTLPATTTSSICVPDSYEVSRLNFAIQPWTINYSRTRALFIYEGRIEATRMLDSYYDAMRDRYDVAMRSIMSCVRVYWEIVNFNSISWPNR